MYSHEIPQTIDVAINTIEYPIETLEYALLKHEAYKNGELVNLFIPDKNNVVLTRASIALMIEFKNTSVRFKIINDFDIIEIYRYLTAYITELEKFKEIKEASDYLTKSKHLHFDIEKSMNILINHGNAKARDVMNHGNIGKLLSKLGGHL